MWTPSCVNRMHRLFCHGQPARAAAITSVPNWARPSNDRPRCNQSSSSSPEVRQGSAAAPVKGFQRRGRRSPTRKPVQCQSSISWLRTHRYDGFPRRQDVVGSNEAHRHREQEARSNQARGRWRWNIEEPASGTDDQAKNESDDSSRHNTALLRTRSNRNRNPISGADAKCENAIG
jgi:hypothetical protein